MITMDREPIFKWETMREVRTDTLPFKEPIQGRIFEVELTRGHKVNVFRADDGRFYFPMACIAGSSSGGQYPCLKRRRYAIRNRRLGHSRLLAACAAGGTAGPSAAVPNMGEVELENVSAKPLEIVYRMTALQYLNLVVTTPDGRVVSEGHFGDRFAPTLAPMALRLEPGDKFRANVHLFATVHCEPIPPGRYLVQAVYDCNGFRAVSEPVPVMV
jgi:hypothetical protein